MGKKTPVIGVCAAYEKIKWSFWDMHAAIVAETYLNHIYEAEAIPFGIAPSAKTPEQAEDIVSRLDALLLVGGVDIDPVFYGQEPDEKLEATFKMRDESEIALVKAAFAAGIPVLGICRGLQIMNVASGGTLHQDIGELGDSTHRKNPGHLDESTYHDVKILEDSRLAKLMGAGDTVVNSHHHQALDAVGEGGKVAAISPDDNIIEAVEWLDGDAIGVQWHPETMDAQRLIQKFIEQLKQNS